MNVRRAQHLHPFMEGSLIDPAVLRLEIDTLALETLHLQDELTTALTYRELLSVALEQWALDQRRLRAANQRLRQVMGIEEWHVEATA